MQSSMYSSSGVSGGMWGLGKVAVEACMQMAVVVRACIQQYATHYQCGALCVLTSTRTVDCCTIYNNIRVNRICVRARVQFKLI